MHRITLNHFFSSLLMASCILVIRTPNVIQQVKLRMAINTQRMRAVFPFEGIGDRAARTLPTTYDLR